MTKFIYTDCIMTLGYRDENNGQALLGTMEAKLNSLAGGMVPRVTQLSLRLDEKVSLRAPGLWPIGTRERWKLPTGHLQWGMVCVKVGRCEGGYPLCH